MEAAVERAFRAESGRALATLARLFGDLSLAEDAVQEAFTSALRTWPRQGVPRHPAAWIIATARNRALDHRRREVARAFLLPVPTMAQRLVRAKGKIRDAGIPGRRPRTCSRSGCPTSSPASTWCSPRAMRRPPGTRWCAGSCATRRSSWPGCWWS